MFTATDSASSLINGTSKSVTVSPGATTSFALSGIAGSVTVSTALNLTVTAQDTFGNLTPGYTGSVKITSSDGAANLPANNTLSGGVGTFTVTLHSLGNQTLTATDAGNASITGSVTTNVSAVPQATHFGIAAPMSTIAGTSFPITVTALLASNSTATAYTGTVHFTSSDSNSNAVLPIDATLTNGVGVFNVTLITAPGETITATDISSSSLNGSSVVSVTAATLSKLAILGTPASITAGSPLFFSVNAEDTFGNVITNYTGTVHFSSTDIQATLPLNTTLNGGTANFSATLKTAANQTINVNDINNGNINATSNTISVTPATTGQFVVVASSSTVTAGGITTFSVTAEDLFGNVTHGYTGTVHFSSTDASVNGPANETLTNGVGTFSYAFKTAGPQTATATDLVTPSINGTSNTVKVTPAATTKFVVSASPNSVTAGGSTTVTVTATDTYGNVTPTYSGTVKFTSSDALFTPPPNSTLTSGVGTFVVAPRPRACKS